MSTIQTRPATSADADAALDAVRQSITVLCTADHQHDAATLERWLRNKTPEHFQRWCRDPDARLVVAVVEAEIAGVAELHRSGEIYLFYVHPDRVHTGVGRALMQALEAQARDWRIATLTLGSTLAARPFYERCGFTPSGAPTLHFGVLHSYPYAKTL